MATSLTRLEEGEGDGEAEDELEDEDDDDEDDEEDEIRGGEKLSRCCLLLFCALGEENL